MRPRLLVSIPTLSRFNRPVFPWRPTVYSKQSHCSLLPLANFAVTRSPSRTAVTTSSPRRNLRKSKRSFPQPLFVERTFPIVSSAHLAPRCLISYSSDWMISLSANVNKSGLESMTVTREPGITLNIDAYSRPITPGRDTHCYISRSKDNYSTRSKHQDLPAPMTTSSEGMRVIEPLNRSSLGIARSPPRQDDQWHKP